MAPGHYTPQASLHEVVSQFVDLYYDVRRDRPGRLADFYSDDSKVGRVAADGFMYNATKQEAIEQNTLLVGGKMSVAFKKIDAQFSINNGVLITVKGNMIDDDIIRSFIQTFFLAPLVDSPSPGYYVYNDMFQYLDEKHHEGELVLEGKEYIEEEHALEEQVLQDIVLVTSDNGRAFGAEQVFGTEQKEHITPVTEIAAAATQVPEAPVAEISLSTTGEAAAVKKVIKASQVEPSPSASKQKPTDSELSEKRAPLAMPPSASVIRQPTSAKSLPSSAPARLSPVNSEKRLSPAPTAYSKASGVTSNWSKNSNEYEADPYGIYVSNLNPYVSHEELKMVFDQFGPVKPSLVRIFSNERTLTNYAFLEFELKSSATKAIEKGEVWIQGRAKIEPKRRFPSKWPNKDTNRGSTSRGGSRGGNVHVANANIRSGSSRSTGNPRNNPPNSGNFKSATPGKHSS